MRLAALLATSLILTISNAWMAAAASEPTLADSLLKIYKFEEVLVTAPRPATTVGGAAAVETHVDSLPLPAAPTTAEVLRQLPLIHVRTNSRGEAEISARGSESRQVAVLVDGVPITLAWDARADVSILPAGAIQDVVYVRGLSSLLHGPNVLGGVVETSIAQGVARPEVPSTHVSFGTDNVGAYGTNIGTSIPVGGPDGNWHIRGGLGYRNSPGDPLAEDIQEPIETDDDLRLNTDVENVDGFLGVSYQADSDAWLSLSGTSFKAERGIAAELGVPDADARLWRYPHVSRTLFVLSGGTGYGSSPFGGHGDVSASVGLDRGRTDIDQYTSRSYDEISGFEDGKDRTISMRMKAQQTLGSRNHLNLALTGAAINHDEIIPDGTFEYRQRLWSAAVEDTWRMMDGEGSLQSLAMTAGVSWDGSDTPEAGGREPLGQISDWGGRFGLSAVLGSRPTVAHAGISRRARFPALRELYSGALNRFAPNPDLKPEELVTLEGGVTTGMGRGEFQAVAFHNSLEDAIVRVTLPDRRFMRVNTKELRSTGVELVASHPLGPVDLSASATFQDVELTDTDTEETSHPENLPEFFGHIGGRFPLPLQLLGEARLRYTGDQYSLDAVSGEEVVLEGEAMFSAALSRVWPLRMSWGPGQFTSFETRLSLDNATDVALYDAWGLPEPGQRLRLELRLR